MTIYPYPNDTDSTKILFCLFTKRASGVCYFKQSSNITCTLLVILRSYSKALLLN